MKEYETLTREKVDVVPFGCGMPETHLMQDWSDKVLDLILNGPTINGIKTGYWSAATKEVLVQKLAAYENTGYEPDEIRAAIEQAAKNSETKTATIMAECIAGAMKDTLEKYGTAGSGKKGETP